MFKLLLISLMLPCMAMAQGTEQKTVVLIHGAFADGSSWDKVIPILQAKGLKVVSVQNPLTSLADDVAAGKRVIDEQSGPVILVGHSWGGTVITQLGDDAKVAALVYVAGFAPDVGESSNDLGKGGPSPPGTQLFRPTDFVRLHTPGKTARGTELLRSFEKCGTSLERFVASHSLNGGARDEAELRDECGVTMGDVGVALALIDGKDTERLPG